MNLLKKLTYKQLLRLPISEFKPCLSDQQIFIINKLSARLKKLDINWVPKTWFAEDWYSPDHIDGFAIPFTLSNDRLIKIEKQFIGQLEGSSHTEFFKLCCHETAHALDNKFKLRLNKKRQNLFGLTSTEYPNSYRPNPFSKNYIEFLGDHYAQAHPDEDWAETVGYILYYQKNQKHSFSPMVQRKIELALEILKSIHLKQRFSINMKSHKPITSADMHISFEEYLLKKRESLGLNKKNYFQGKLSKEFKKTNRDSSQSVTQFINQNRSSLMTKVQESTGSTNWVINRCMQDLKKECKKNQYSLKYNKQKSSAQISSIVESNINSFVKKGFTQIYM